MKLGGTAEAYSAFVPLGMKAFLMQILVEQYEKNL